MRLFRLQVFRTTNLTHHLIFLDIFLLLQLNINVFDKVSLQKETYTSWETIRAENTFKSELHSSKYNFKELRILFNKFEIIWLCAYIYCSSKSNWAMVFSHNFDIDLNNGLPHLECHIYDFDFAVYSRLMSWCCPTVNQWYSQIGFPAPLRFQAERIA